MKTQILLLALAAFPLSVLAADVTGTWKADSDTQRGLQKYTFRLKHWVGGFSSAPNTRFRISQGLHAYLKEKNVPHVWHVDEHAHDFQQWKAVLYNFSQLLFKPTT